MRKCAQLLGESNYFRHDYDFKRRQQKRETRAFNRVARDIVSTHTYAIEKCTCYLLSYQARATKSTICGLNACNVQNARHMLPVPR